MTGALALMLPWGLLLALPAAAWWWRHRAAPGLVWRAVLLALTVGAVAWPVWSIGRGGSDVVVVLDRSASMGEERQRHGELARLAGDQRRHGDRLAVVAVADGVAVAQGPRAVGVPEAALLTVPEQATDLAAGLELAASLIPPGRSGRVLLASDGEFTGADPRPAAAALAARGLPLDVLPVRRPATPDAAVVRIELPDRLRLGESFAGAVVLAGEARERRAWRVRRGTVTVAEGVAELAPGRETTLPFADRPPAPGVARYLVELDATDDREPRNNRAAAALRVDAGGERVLVVGGDGAPGAVATALAAAGFAVTTRPAGRLTLEALLPARVLVLDDVPADALGCDALEAVAQWVEHLGGGLVMTGGRRSFGPGGYHLSRIEDVLPVTMELRDEHRKLAVSLAMAIDRSGSMSIPVPDGRRKIELADEGVCAAISMLGPRDEVAVFAVDSAPYNIVPLQRVSDRETLTAQVRGINSQGGGIFIYEALKACAGAIARGTAGTRHVLLFADAADSEEPGEYKTLLADLVTAGVTVSVIGMGSERDCDAALLKDIALRGGGRCTFAERAEDIPRLFAQETVVVARSAWVKGPVALRPEPTLGLELGRQAALDGAWPEVQGYNLVYPRPRAAVLATAPGDPSGPAVAAWRIGTGRSVAVTAALADAEETALLAWGGYAPLVASLCRWAAGDAGEPPASLLAERRGRNVALRLECDLRQRDRLPTTPPEVVVAGRERRRVTLMPVDDGVYAGSFTLADDDLAVPATAIAGQAVVGPALCLPYPPEVEPRFRQPPGLDVLADLARPGGGSLRADLAGLFANPPSPGRPVDLAPWLLAAIALLWVVEIAWRRLAGGGRRRASATATATAKTPPTAAVPAPAPMPLPQRRKREPLAQVPMPAEPPATVLSTESPPPETPAATGGNMDEALRQLRQRRGKG